eukprot:Gb_17512 [translate_table: standard]
MAGGRETFDKDLHHPVWGQSLQVDSVQELAAKRLQTVPERYIRPQDERPFTSILSSQLTIPVIDLALLNVAGHQLRHDEMAKLAKACEEWGFFQVVNHGISHHLLEKIRKVATEFFKLPLEEKKRYAPQPGDVQGYGQMFVVSEEQKLDWNDLLALMLMPHNLRNLSLWPTNPIEFRETVETYAGEIQKVAGKLSTLFAENLALKGDYFNQKFGEAMQMMRMNYYPPCPRPDLVVGLSPHADGGGITLLLQDDQTEGLHVRKGDQWIPVEPIPNALVVNIADMIEVMTNGRYKSVEHRAVTNQEKERLSIAMFYHPSFEAEVWPAEDLVDGTSNPCFHKKFRQDDYIHFFLGKTLDGKCPLSQFAKIH